MENPGKVSKRNEVSPKTLRLVESAVMLGLATALSMVKLWQMPLGGSVTLCSMLPILLISYKYGPKWGIGVGFAYSIIQMMLDIGAVFSWGLTPIAVAASFIFDYLFAFTMLGLAGIYGKGLRQFVCGFSTAVGLRFVWHVIAGVTAYLSVVPKDWAAHPFLYSIAYNGLFLLPDFAICLGVGLLIYRCKPLRNYLDGNTASL
jgi:thiamine transporter